MTESSIGSEDSDEHADFSIDNIIAFRRRLENDPDAVSDEEICAEYGADIPPNELRELFRRGTFGKRSKTQRASARSKLRRRLVWLDRSLEEVEDAVKQVLASPGRTNKHDDLNDLLAAIDQFRSVVKLPKPVSSDGSDPDFLERLLSGSHSDWEIHLPRHK